MGKTDSQTDGGLHITAQARAADSFHPAPPVFTVGRSFPKHLLISVTDSLVRELRELGRRRAKNALQNLKSIFLLHC